MEYLKRIAEDAIQKKLGSSGAVLIEGPKWCGKTTTGAHLSKSVLHMDDPDRSRYYLTIADIEPSSLLNGDKPRLIDEWQLAPSLWNAVRYAADTQENMGQFILTGSSSPKEMPIGTHSGIGRISKVKMRTMSLYESNNSNGSVSLADLFDGKKPNGFNKGLNILELSELICRGGWPHALSLNKDDAFEVAFNYYDALMDFEINKPQENEEQLDPERAKKVLRSYARNVAQSNVLETLRKDCLIDSEDTFSTNTLYKYLSFFQRRFVFENSLAWNPNLRSKTAIRSSETNYFVDPSIGTAALGLGPKDLCNDIRSLGFFFENLAIRDLRIYADNLNGQVYHYRDKDGLECDAVIHLRNGDYGLIEIKLGGERLIEEGAKNLLSLASKIDTSLMKKPSFLMVLTGTEDIAFQRNDGVSVVPISCLKP